jgi:hypothetical protein
LLHFFLTEAIFAQKYKLKEIPIISLQDFKGKKPANISANIAAYTVLGTFYDVKKMTSLDNGCIYVCFDVKTIQSKQLSWVDPSLLKSQKKMQAIIQHEQGHVMIGYLFGNELSKKLNKLYCNGNYQQQAKYIFQNLYFKYGSLNKQYDKESENGNNTKSQQIWINKLKAMFKV